MSDINVLEDIRRTDETLAEFDIPISDSVKIESLQSAIKTKDRQIRGLEDDIDYLINKVKELENRISLLANNDILNMIRKTSDALRILSGCDDNGDD